MTVVPDFDVTDMPHRRNVPETTGKSRTQTGLPRCIRLLAVWSAVLQQSGVRPACFFDLRRKKAARPAAAAAAAVHRPAFVAAAMVTFALSRPAGFLTASTLSVPLPSLTSSPFRPISMAAPARLQPAGIAFAICSLVSIGLSAVTVKVFVPTTLPWFYP